MIVELHILQNFAPSCLNRDDTNTPKDCLFGGHRRARVSSQCIKRAIRENQEFDRVVESQGGVRTKRLAIELAKRIKGNDDEKTVQLFAKVLDEAGMSSDKEGRTNIILFIDKIAVDELVGLFRANLPALEKGSKEAKDMVVKGLTKTIAERVKVPDIALFGRMLAIEPSKPLGKLHLNIDAACQVAHAISTHKVGVESDFYTAVDDFQPEEKTGAGMMGDIQFNSACFYRYANIDLNQLKTNLDGDAELVKKTVEAFIRAAVAAIPSGKKNSFAPQNPPDFVCAIVRDNGEWSLANAFSKPVRDGGDLTGESIDALINYWGRLNTAYPPKEGSIKAKPAFTLTDSALTGLDNVNNIEKLVTLVNQAIAKDC